MMKRHVAPQRGRPKKEGELAGRRKDINFTPSEWGEVETHVKEKSTSVGTKLKPGTYIHDLTMRVVRGQAPNMDSALPRSFRAPFMTKAPCGPWEDALEHAGHFVLSEQVADELEVRDGDVIVRAMGESMEGMGIMDGALLLMRPLPDGKSPLRGEVALVQIVTKDGELLGTIKQWMPGDPPILKDGEGHVFEVPDGVQEIRAVAVARGIIGRM